VSSSAADSLPTRRPDRAALPQKTEAIVTKSISGHQTDRMREHYSTVTPEEQRRSIGNVVQLFGARKSGEGSGEGDRQSGEEPQKSHPQLTREALIFHASL
jgi:hypothetical protein